MHKVFIDAGVEYLVGYLRYGHYEGELEIPDEEWEEFQANPKKWIKDHDKDGLELLVDDWRIEDVGDIDNVTWEEQ